MKAYVLGNYTIDDMQQYQQYTAAVMPTVQMFGGQTLIVESSATILEGDPHAFTVAVEFPSEAVALQWYHSPQYQQIVDFRKKAVRGWVQIVHQFAPPQKGAPR